MTIEVDNAAPAVLADPGLLERVIANLTANALTHGRARAVVARAAACGDQVELRIVDHGPGLPASPADRCSRRSSGAETRDNTSGVGLGLAVARRSPKRWAAPCAPSTPPAAASPW